MHLSSILAIAALQSAIAYAQGDSNGNVISGGLSGNGNSIGNNVGNCNGASLNDYCCDGTIINTTGQDASNRNGDDDYSDLTCCEGDSNNNILLGSDSPTTCSAGTSMSLTKASSSGSASSTSGSSNGTRTGMPANSTASTTSGSESTSSDSDDSASSSTSTSSAGATSASSSDESTSSGDSGAAMVTALPVVGMLAGVGGALVAAL